MRRFRAIAGLASALVALGLLVNQSELGRAAGLRVQAALIEILETRFARADLDSGSAITGIIALGGNPDRTVEAMRLARLYPQARLIVSGAKDYELAATLIEPIEPERTFIESRATNTFENALFSRQMAEPKAGERWLLVTSATHMPRALGCFQGVGFPVEPWPVYDRPTGPRNEAAIVKHEWLGLVAYRLMGRTKALFPAQAPRAERTQRADSAGPAARTPPDGSRRLDGRG